MAKDDGRGTGADKAHGRKPTSFVKGVNLLGAFIDRQPEWGVRELANAVGEPSSSVHRSLQALRDAGLLDWDEERRKYCLGMEFYRWSGLVAERIPLRNLGLPVMRDLSDQTGETVWLGLYDPTRRREIIVAEIRGRHCRREGNASGAAFALDSSAGGKAILASLSGQTVLGGYIVHYPEAPGDPLTIAAPVVEANGRAVGTLTIAVSGPVPQEDRMELLGASVAEQATRLSELLGARILGGGGAGTWHVGLGVIAGILRNSVPGVEYTGWLGAGDRNLGDLESGRGAYCLAVADSLEAAVTGRAPFSRPHGNLRAMFSLFPLYLHVLARTGTGIRSFSEIPGHRLSAGEAGYTTASVMRELLALHGDARLASSMIDLTYAEANRELSQGSLDAVASLTGLQDPAYVEMAEREELRLVGFDDALLDRFLAGHPGFAKGRIPAGSYNGTTVDTPTLIAPTVMVTTRHRSDEEVYEVTRSLFASRAELAAAATAYASFGAETALEGIVVPLHRGAARFWHEQGIRLPPSATGH
ncbi:MAG: TAXI family TRAP transporter solute-binding subunit [Paracoccaceae bacterium]